MFLAVAIRNRLAVCSLLLMLSPFGLSTPTIVKAAQAEEPALAEAPGQLWVASSEALERIPIDA